MNYPSLPAVELPGRWDHRITATVSNEVDGVIHAVIHTEVTAKSAAEAQARSLAVMDYDYEDDLRGAVATAEKSNTKGRWSVTITMAPYR